MKVYRESYSLEHPVYSRTNVTCYNYCALPVRTIFKTHT